MIAESQNLAPVIPILAKDAWSMDSCFLNELGAGLSSVEQVTESSFLELGNNIHWLHERTMKISQAAGDVLDILAGDSGEASLQHLQLLVERCNLWLDTTDKKSTETCTLLDDIRSQVDELESVTVGSP